MAQVVKEFGYERGRALRTVAKAKLELDQAIEEMTSAAHLVSNDAEEFFIAAEIRDLILHLEGEVKRLSALLVTECEGVA